jgi:cytoskeleton protein RodZ
MKEGPDAPVTGTQGVPPVGAATPGGLLRQERERRGASIQQAAEDLHLDPKLVEAIEANRFEALGAPVYAKGHLRKYATLLNLSPDVVVARYDALAGTPEVPTPVPASAPPPPRRNRGLRIPLLVVGILIVIGLFGWMVVVLLAPPPPAKPTPAIGSPKEETAVTPSPPAQPPAMGMPAPTRASTPSVAAASARTPLKQPAVVATTVPPLTAPASPAVAPQARVGDVLRLRLEFSEPSWIEVYDAGDERLVYAMGTPERARSVAGVAPLTVVVGLASAVTAEVNGRSVAIPQSSGRDGARFEIGVDGAVR